jgi:uncharacterized coiled-coil protein SlyX
VTSGYEDRYEDDVDYEPSPKPRRRPWLSILIVVGLAATGVASAFVWRSYGLQSFPIVSSGIGAPAETTEKVPGIRELQALEQQSAAQMQTALQLLTAQQAETKRLSDQLTALVGKVDSLQRTVADLEQQPRPSAPKPVAPAAPKKPAAPNQSATRAPPPAPVQLTPAPPNRP